MIALILKITLLYRSDLIFTYTLHVCTLYTIFKKIDYELTFKILFRFKIYEFQKNNANFQSKEI